MAVKDRRARQKEKLRKEILDTARQMFLRDGYEHFSMRKLAEKIEYSPTTIYLYFRDKADLLAELCDASFAKLVQQLETIASLATDPLEGLRASMLAYVEFGTKNPANYLVTFVLPDSMLGSDSALRLRPESSGTRTLDCLRVAVDACMRAGKIRKADPETVVQVIWAALHGVASLLVVHPTFPWVERDALVDQVVDTTIQGLTD